MIDNIWLSGKESTCQCKRHKRHKFNPWTRKIPWRRKWQPTPVFLHGKSQGQRSLAGYSPWSHKEPDMTKHSSTAYIYIYIHPSPSPRSRDSKEDGLEFYIKSPGSPPSLQYEKPRCSRLRGDLPFHVRSPWSWTGQEYGLSLILSFAEKEIQVSPEWSGGSGRAGRHWI